MSFGVWLKHDELEWQCGHGYTYNVGDFFRWALEDERGLYALRDMRAADAVPRLRAALARVTRDNLAELRVRYDAANGWGDVPGAVLYLREIFDECRKAHPDAVLTV